MCVSFGSFPYCSSFGCANYDSFPQKMKVLCGFVLQNRMDVKNQIAERERFLIKVFGDAPDSSCLYSLAVGKQRTFCQQFVDGSDFAVDGAVVDHDIRVDSGGVERFHLDRHRGQRVFLAAFVERNILPAAIAMAFAM